MSEELQKAGLYIDDIYRLRVQDPRIANETNELREECLKYADKLNAFKKLSDDFHKILVAQKVIADFLKESKCIFNKT